MPFPRSRTVLVSAAAVAGRSARPAVAGLRGSLLLATARTSPSSSAGACTQPTFRCQALFHSSARLFGDAAARAAPVTDGSTITKERFDSITAMHPETARAIKQVFKYENMSPVQTAILGKLPTDRDMFVKAKTGTGKTLAFLIPAIETLLKRRAERKAKDGGIVIISPTRELAMQIAEEADKISKYHGFVIHELVGGNSKRQQMDGLARHPKDIIVGTPGRLRDLIDSSREFGEAVKKNDVLILDEADQLLEMGFREAIQDVINFFPKSRQTLLFSATVSREVKGVANIALRDDHDFVDLVPANEQNVHMHIPQLYAIHNTPKVPELIHRILQANEDKKVMLFCPTTKATQVYADFLRMAGIRRVFELHSGKAQASRTNTSDRFRNSHSGVLVTTDVSARGVDYPDVHLIVQAGMPTTRDQYIHRIGRTGRAGKGGSALLVLNPWEKAFLETIRDLPIKMCGDWSAEAMARKYSEGLLEDSEGDKMRKQAAERIDASLVQDCIKSLCGYYSTNQCNLSSQVHDLPDHLASFAHAFNVPAPDRKSLQRYLGTPSSRSTSSFSRGGGFYRNSAYRGGSSYGGGGSYGGGSSHSSGRISQMGGGRRRPTYDGDN